MELEALGRACLVMPFSHTDYDAKTRDLMTAALNTALMTISLGLDPSELDRTRMIAAIIDAVAAGERDFLRLQQKAIDAWGVRPLVKAVERRKRLRLVTSTDDDASDGPGACL
jgi:hypothetical protein